MDVLFLDLHTSHDSLVRATLKVHLCFAFKLSNLGSQDGLDAACKALCVATVEHVGLFEQKLLEFSRLFDEQVELSAYLDDEQLRFSTLMAIRDLMSEQRQVCKKFVVVHYARLDQAEQVIQESLENSEIDAAMWRSLKNLVGCLATTLTDWQSLDTGVTQLQQRIDMLIQSQKSEVNLSIGSNLGLLARHWRVELQRVVQNNAQLSKPLVT